MIVIQRSTLVVGKRQRSEIEKSDLIPLRDSILSRGLLHPPIASWEPESCTWRLIAGERRLRALDLIAEAEQFFMCDGETLLPGEIPITRLCDLSPSDLFDAELEENLLRKDLEWQDRIRAIAESHARRKIENPEQTITDTAREFVDSGLQQNRSYVAQTIKEATIISQHLTNPSIAKARNAKEAFALVVQNEEAAYGAELIRRRASTHEAELSPIEVRHGDAAAILPRLDSELFDLVLADPPYGVGVGAAGFRNRTVHHHNYEDSPEAARNLISLIVSEGFRVTKPRANLFIFTDIDLFDWSRTICKQAGWVPFRTPIIWAKSDSEGLAPWGRAGFRRTYELILYATKGSRGLIHSPVDILRHNRVSRADREYGPEKPEDLLRTLIEASTLPNDSILDPCCGSGSTLGAARDLRRRALGIELDESAFNLSLRRAQGERPDDPETRTTEDAKDTGTSTEDRSGNP